MNLLSIEKKKKYFEGTIVPISWEENGDVKKVSLYTDDGEDFILRRRFKYTDFLKLLNHRVRVFGNLIGMEDECEVISVARVMKKKNSHFPPANQLNAA